jgi:hypothetical protein
LSEVEAQWCETVDEIVIGPELAYCTLIAFVQFLASAV